MARCRGNDIQRDILRQKIREIELRRRGIGGTRRAANGIHLAAIHGEGTQQAGTQNQITFALAAYVLRHGGQGRQNGLGSGTSQQESHGVYITQLVEIHIF